MHHKLLILNQILGLLTSSQSPANVQSPLGKIPAVSELLLIDVIAGEFGMVHGFAPLRCFLMAALAHPWATRHSYVLYINASSRPVIKSNSRVGDERIGCKWA